MASGSEAGSGSTVGDQYRKGDGDGVEEADEIRGEVADGAR